MTDLLALRVEEASLQQIVTDSHEYFIQNGKVSNFD